MLARKTINFHIVPNSKTILNEKWVSQLHSEVFVRENDHTEVRRLL